MQPTNYPIRHDILQQYWQGFTETGRVPNIPAARLDPVVRQSWLRCAPRLDPYAQPRLKYLGDQALLPILRTQTNLITIAIPFMEDIYQFIEGSNCATVLTDGSSCNLAMTGDDSAIRLMTGYGLGQGTYWSEGHVGTNALGITLFDAMPVQVVGAEHYFQIYHSLVTTAAPIHAINGRIIGVLGIVGLVETASSHTLALVMAAARAISNQLHASLYLEEANQRLTEVNTIVETIGEGILTWNSTGRITHLNAQAARMLHLHPSTTLGRSLAEALTLPPILQEAIANGQEMDEAEVNFEVNGQAARALVSLRAIRNQDPEPIGFVAKLRPIEEVRRLVHQQVGTEATLLLEDVAAYSPAMRPVLRQARIAARGSAPVLLRGEGGVGKNHLARVIHSDGAHADRPFIAINCRAIPHELMISEFLGYEKDGPAGGRPSKFELANGGTLMFDQIESLSLEMQAALLSVIETGHVMRLGSTRPVRVDLRIIAATSANLEQYVADESFLPHLYYRFGVFNITIPPLRQRLDDIPLLAERYLARITQRRQKEAWIDDEALEVLRRYPWPGNVRELESVLERALSQCQDFTIRVADLPESVRKGRVMLNNSPQPAPVLTTAEAEREAILRAGLACQGHIAEMAQQLGIGRTTLWRKMKRYDISRDQFRP